MKLGAWGFGAEVLILKVYSLHRAQGSGLGHSGPGLKVRGLGLEK